MKSRVIPSRLRNGVPRITLYVIVDVGYIEVLFDVLISKGDGARSAIADCRFTADTRQLESHRVLELFSDYNCSMGKVRGNHYPLTPTV